MVYMITGAIDQGKTGKMNAIYQGLRQGDGFLSAKVFKEGVFTGYEIVRLSTGETLPLAYKAGYVPGDWDEMYRCGPYRFSKKAFEFAGQIVNEIIAKGIEPVFIDEIGPLELAGQGFCALLEKVLKTGRDVYIAVRSHCAAQVVKKFGIRNGKEIPIG